MDTKEIKSNICQKNGLQPSSVLVYQNGFGTFALVYKTNTKAIDVVSQKDIEEINKRIGEGEATFAAFSNHFQNNPKVLELATNYILRGGNMMSLQGIVDFVNKTFTKKMKNNRTCEEELSILKSQGAIEGFEVQNQNLVGPQFRAIINVERLSKNNQSRCCVEEIETKSEAKDNGYCAKMFSSFLPHLCSMSYINSITLSVDQAHEDGQKSKNSMKDFYKNCGFYEVENLDDFDCVKQSDFENGNAVFVKYVDFDRIFE